MKALRPLLDDTVRRALAEYRGEEYLDPKEKLPYYLKVGQAAKTLKRPKGFILEMIDEGAIDSIDIALAGSTARCLRIKRDSLREWQRKQADKDAAINPPNVP